MISISDVIKTKFIEEFTAISVGSLLTAELLAFLLGLFVVVVYRLTYGGVSFSKSFALSLLMLAMVTSLAILTVSSNVMLSLGMVGALSIVRFRTAVKDPMDTMFMFWEIVVGIMTGAGYVTVSILATLLLAALFLLVHMLSGKFRSNVYLVSVRYMLDDQGHDILKPVLAKLPAYKLRSRAVDVEGNVELVLEMKLNEETLEKVNHLGTVKGVTDVNVISYNGGTLL